MQYRLDLLTESKPEWVEAVLNDFDTFLADHADCERKASAMAMSFVAKYPDRKEIIPELIDTGIEELEHFKQVYALMQERNILLNHEIKQDPYVNALLDHCRTSTEERFMDRLLIASVVETRGAERFQKIYEALEDPSLREFYHHMWAADARHGNIFVRMALNYFNRDVVYNRLEELNTKEAEVVDRLEIRAALH